MPLGPEDKLQPTQNPANDRKYVGKNTCNLIGSSLRNPPKDSSQIINLC
jgi:hypothetical protein